MKRIIVSVALLLGGVLITFALAPQSAQERAASLRAQLAAVQAKQDELQTRLQQLEEALKPDNIQNSLAGIGSTHPEDLRELRRRQLEHEKAGVNAQLEQLAASRTRLETAITRADNDAYQQSARPGAPVANTQGPDAAGVENSKPTTHYRQRRVKRHKAKRDFISRPAWLFGEV